MRPAPGRALVLVMAVMAGRSHVVLPQAPAPAARMAAAVQVPRMPRLIGLPLDSAQLIVRRLGLELSRVNRVANTATSGTVIGQSIKEQSEIRRGMPIELTVSIGGRPPSDDGGPRADSVEVPNLFGQPRLALAISLGIAKLGIGRTDSARDPRHDGQVIAQRPQPGTRVPVQSVVNLTFGYALRVTVPNLMDHTPEDAGRLLSDAGLLLGSVKTVSTDQGKGLVTRQSQPAGRVVRESTVVDVQIEVSSLVPTPDVLKLLLPRARQVLDSAGFVMGRIDSVAGNPPANLVVRQNPAPGQLAAPGSPVHLQVSMLRQVVHVPDLKDSTLAAAARVLRDSGLVLRGIDSTPRPGRPGLVVTQSPLADALVVRGSPVSVRISTTVPPAIVPNVVDSTPQAALLALEQRALAVGTVTTVPQARNDTVVLAQDPLSGTPVTTGTKVNLRVAVPDTVLTQIPSSGTLVDSGSVVSVRVGPPVVALVTVPDVIRNQAADAAARLQQARLGALRLDTTASSGDVGRVVRQVPTAGDTVPVGTVVRLTIGVWVWPPWLKILVTVLGLGALAGAIHKIWKKKPQPNGDPEKRDQEVRGQMAYTVCVDDGHQIIPDRADPAGSPELGLEVRSDPGEQIVEGGGP